MSQDPKAIASFLLATLEYEIPVTAGVFAALPADRLDYRPDPVSKSALELMRHVTLEDEWILNAVADGKFADHPDHSDACGIMTPADAVARYKERIPAAMDKVRGTSAEDFGRVIGFDGFEMPALQFLSLMVRHSVHHRGQMSAYLRAMGGKVPSIYGPSADTGGH